MARRKRVVLRVKRQNRGWALTGPRELRNWFPSQYEAIARGRYEAHQIFSHGCLAQLVVHGRDGKIRTEWTYGADPRRYKG